MASRQTIGGPPIASGLLTRPAAFTAAGHLAFVAARVIRPNGFARPRGV